MKFLRNKLAVFALAVVAVGGIAFLVWAAGANVNCFGGQCYSTNGRDTSTGGTNDATATGVFTGENDTASIECRGVGGGGDTTFDAGGGNDVLYLRDPATGSAAGITVSGEDGDDVIVDGCNVNDNFLNGGNGNDVLIKNANNNTRFYGDNGNDLLVGGQGDDFLGDANGNGTCNTNESDPGNDVFVGGPGLDNYCTADNDGNDIVIIHAGDVQTGNETYTCEGDDTILLFGFDLDLVLTHPNTATTGRFFKLTAAPGGLAGNEVAIGDPKYNPTGDPTGARYTFRSDNSGATGTCTIIAVE